MGGHRRGLLLFDFDGTVYRGDAPFREYAAQIARAIPESDRETFLGRAARQLAGVREVEAGDPWHAMARLAEPYQLDRTALHEAFMKTRAYMMTDACRLEVPAVLPSFLTRARRQVVVALASNSPREACLPLLQKLGLQDAFHLVRPSAHKPEGLLPLIAELEAQFETPPGQVMSVGDYYVNDIAPAQSAGFRTAYISPGDYFPGPVDLAGKRLEDVLPGVAIWIEGLRP
jgi:FMN phosphatase YigB (HAD superfamily)